LYRGWDIYDTDYLWHEKEIKSVANIIRRDVREFLPLAAEIPIAEIPITPEIKEFRLEEANQALISLKHGEYRGAGVLSLV
jgi:Zn-dependent alcohol dehydrogenases